MHSSHSAVNRIDRSIQLLAIDVDGTLLNSRGELSAVNREALHRAHRAGMTISLCTGRNWIEAQTVIDQIGLDLTAGIFVFGAVVADLMQNRVTFRNSMSPNLADRLVRHLGNLGHHVLVLYDRTEAGCDYVLVEGSGNGEAYDRWLTLTPSRAERMAEWQPRDCPPLRVGIIERPERIEKTLSGLQATFPPDQAKINSIYAPNYGFHVVECFSPKVNKWHGITQLAERLGIPLNRVATVGDDVNDLEMISHAGFGVAMGNAIPAVKAVAAWETRTNDQDGVALLIDRLLADSAPTSPKRVSSCS